MDFCKPRAYKSVSSSETIDLILEEKIEEQKEQKEQTEEEQTDIITSVIQKIKNILLY